jgi:ABC-type uncharacterized transport system ATPase component
VSNLSGVRENWDLAQKQEKRLLRTMTVQESLALWGQLQRAFEWQLQQTAEIFESDRQAALVDLQKRLLSSVQE